ncbi:hypothetical protein GCM10027570_55450 [Streptomonospora sediminis]
MSTPSPTRARPARALTPDMILGLVLAAVAVGFLAYTLELSAGAAAWPRVVLVLLLILGIAITVRAARARTAAASAAEGADRTGTETAAADSAGSGGGVAAPAAPPADEAESADGADAAEPAEWSARLLRRPALTLGIVVVYVALLEIIGFLPATALYLLGHLWFGGVRDWRILAGVVVGVVAFIQLLFVHQLSVPLPTGLLFE